MAAENERIDEENAEEQVEESSRPNFLQSNIVKYIIRFLGWGVAILVGVALMFLTATLVLEARGDDPRKANVMNPRKFEPQPIYGHHPLDQFTINLDKTDPNDKTTMVTTRLVLAYPEDNAKIAGELNKRKEQLSDVLQTIIARKRFEEINTSEKRQNFLKQELIDAVNRNLVYKGIVDIYITEFEISRF
jgi:flagellar basal body-associated protein FliL